MLRKILPILLALIGLAAGGAAGYFLRPAPEPALEAAADPHAPAPAGAPAAAHGEAAADGHAEAGTDEHGEAVPTAEYVKLNNQFVVPVIEKGQVTSLVVLSLSLEVSVGATEKVYAAEPKIRDLLLQVLFEHANAGGFKGSFTDTATMEDLRRAMLEAARLVLADSVSAVLISDIVRQDSQ